MELQEEPFDAVITLIGDHIVHASQVSPPDTDVDHTFFDAIMKFSDEQKDKAAKDAMEFFNTTHGLDFSQSVPEQGRRHYQNASMYPVRPPLELFAYFNRWTASDVLTSKRYRVHIGGYVVSFSGEQVLHGMYGGKEGKVAKPGDLLGYQFYNIPVGTQEPINFLTQTVYPIRQEPIDGHTVSNMEVFHPRLGKGRVNGVVQEYTPTPEDPSAVHLIFRAIITFPDSPANLTNRS